MTARTVFHRTPGPGLGRYQASNGLPMTSPRYTAVSIVHVPSGRWNAVYTRGPITPTPIVVVGNATKTEATDGARAVLAASVDTDTLTAADVEDLHAQGQASAALTRRTA